MSFEAKVIINTNKNVATEHKIIKRKKINESNILLSKRILTLLNCLGLLPSLYMDMTNMKTEMTVNSAEENLILEALSKLDSALGLVRPKSF